MAVNTNYLQKQTCDVVVDYIRRSE